MKKGQGALEYLIIIAAVLAVAAIVVYFLTGALGGQQEQASFAECKNAAAACKNSRLLTPMDPCVRCEEACSDIGSGEELYPGAVDCCKAGKPQYIYDGATACEAPPSSVCGNDITETGEECDGDSVDCSTLGNYESGTNAPCLSDCSGYDTSVCTESPPPPSCGNGVLEGTEVCDGGSADCSTLGNYESGTNAPCKADCTGYDTSVCVSPMSVSVTANPTSGTPPLTVSFTCTATGGALPYTYSWSFGDTGSSTTQNPSHTYTTGGTYTATCTVTDSASRTASSSTTISVSSWVEELSNVAYSFVTFNGKLYAGVSGSAAVYEYDGTTWTEHSVPSSSGRVTSLAATSTNLYAFIDPSSSDSDTTQIYKYTGSSWENIKQLTSRRDDISPLAVLSGILYATDAREVFAYDGASWTTVHSVGAGTYPYIFSLAVFNNALYRGMGGREKRVYKYNGGTSWTNIGTLPNDVYELNGYNGNLYAGLDGGTVYKYTTSWAKVLTLSGDISAFAVHDNKLYIGTKSGKIYEYSAGTVTETYSRGAIYDLISFNNKLYAATSNGIFKHL